MERISKTGDGFALGATLYMPVIHPGVPDILAGVTEKPASSIVLCLEDALHESDVERGVKTLSSLLSRFAPGTGDRPEIFVRPRSLDMAARLAGLDGISRIDGFVAPKMRVESAADWISVARVADVSVMPTLETPDYFDPGRVVALRDMIRAEGADRIAAVRIGGNDLLGSMGLRRVAGATSYEGPLSGILQSVATILGASGIPVAAPVYDVIHDLNTLEKEVLRDVAMGFLSKTAIHPAQVPVIENAMRVSRQDLDAARAILEESARAVFQIGGVMCEPATHRPWARRVMARAQSFGLDGETGQKKVAL
mgnify:CR=1 FL=1